MSYYYNRFTKECVSEVPTKDGKKMKAITIKEVRESKGALVPSVTQILKQIAKPELQNWIIDQAINSALTLPRIENEPLDNFKKRAVEDYQSQSEQAKNTGTLIHDIVEQMLVPPFSGDNYKIFPVEYNELLLNTMDFIQKNKIFAYDCEKVYYSEKFAGRVDFVGETDIEGESVSTIIDWKTQNVKNGKPDYYDDFIMQLGAYKYMVGTEYQCISVVLSKTDQKVYFKKWTDKEISRGFRMFSCLLDYWRIDKGIGE